jgi:hypothetical protein
MHEWQRLSHVRWECKYQVVIIATGMPNPSPQRGLPYVYGPLGGAFLMPRPMAVGDSFFLPGTPRLARSRNW